MAIIQDGYLWLPNTDGVSASGWRLHEGVRLATYNHPDDPERLIIHLLGGPSVDDVYEDGLVFSITKRGLCDLIDNLHKVIEAAVLAGASADNVGQA